LSGQPSTITVAGSFRIHTGFPIKLFTKQHQKRQTVLLRSGKHVCQAASYAKELLPYLSHKAFVRVNHIFVTLEQSAASNENHSLGLWHLKEDS